MGLGNTMESRGEVASVAWVSMRKSTMGVGFVKCLMIGMQEIEAVGDAFGIYYGDYLINKAREINKALAPFVAQAEGEGFLKGVQEAKKRCDDYRNNRPTTERGRLVLEECSIVIGELLTPSSLSGEGVAPCDGVGVVEKCKWNWNKTINRFETGCQCVDANPYNKFCPYCGKEIEEIKP